MLDRLSVPRRAFDFEDYIDILRRNFRWVIGPAFAGIVISTVIAFLMEDTYQSQALIRIVPQQISGELIRSISSQDVTDRVQSMQQTILSRTTLTNLISTYGLYKDELKREPMEDVLTQMHEAIKIEPVVPVGNLQTGRSFPAMRVQFSYRDRFIARKVCEDVVSRFMSASSTDQLNNSLSAETFLSDEFDNKKRALDAAEQKLQDYKMRNQGKLPEQMQANIASMSALEQRLSSLTDNQTHNSQQRMMLDTQLQTAKNRLASVKATTGTSAVKNAKAMEIDKEVEDLQSQIASMKDRYTDDYPDLQAAKDRLAVLKRQREDVNKSSSVPVEGGPESIASARERVEAQAQIDAIQTALNATKISDAALNRDIAAVNGQLHAFEGRIQESPAGEKEYMELERDREVAKATFEQAQQKMQLAKDSLAMERQKQGETLELLDPASTPTTPTAPKRAIYIPMGLAAGLLLGFILVAIREVRDTSLKNLKDARLYTQLSILGSIPLLENDVVVQRRKQVMWVGWATATILGFAVMGASVAHYFLSKT
jgi:polysaccharide chain length determinant protein (PEP-CTERM system associated)